MAECKSNTISRRRELLEEVLEERSKVVAALPIDDQEPQPWSAAWPLGAMRVAPPTPRSARTRRAALELAVLALAWLEAFDRDDDAGG